MAARRRKQLSGYQKMKASGKRPILLTVTAEQHQSISKAASLEMRPVSQFVMTPALKPASAVISDAEDWPK